MDIIRCMPESVTIDFRRKEHRYPYPGVPTRVVGESHDVLFLANKGYIVGIALIIGIGEVDLNDDMEYLEQGPPREPNRYHYIVTGKTTRLDDGPTYKGHMGIRYVDRIKDEKLRKYLQAKAKAYRAKPHPLL